MPIILRPAVTAEAPALRQLARTAYGLYLPRLDREPAPILADYEGQIAAGMVTVACDAETLVGLLVCYPRRDHLHVANVAVSPEAQGRGIGRLLMQRAEDVARERSLGAIELYTHEVMVENFAFYASLGYTEMARGEQEGYARVFYRKELGNAP